MAHIGGLEAYEQLKKSAGGRSLIILEGLDEIAVERQKSDTFLVSVIEQCTLLEKATVLITSRPHACGNINAGRRIEVVGFSKDKINEFARKSFGDIQIVGKFLSLLNEYPHILSLCYIPINLVMIVDIFKVNKEDLPSTITELYQLFIVMILQRQMLKRSYKLTSIVLLESSNFQVISSNFLKGIPKEAVKIVFALCRLAYHSFFEWYDNQEKQCERIFKNFKWARKLKHPKIIYTVDDLNQCGIEVTAEWDGYGLLKATHAHQLPIDTVTYNFTHLTVQTFLCALYISTLSDSQQHFLLNKYFEDHSDVFIFLYGLTRLETDTKSKFVFDKLKSQDNVTAAVRCVYESQQTVLLFMQSTTPLELILHAETLPYDCLCISYVLSFYPVKKLTMHKCHIGDKGAEMLVKHYPSTACLHCLQELNVWNNGLTMTGLKHLMKIVLKSKVYKKSISIVKHTIIISENWLDNY